MKTWDEIWTVRYTQYLREQGERLESFRGSVPNSNDKAVSRYWSAVFQRQREQPYHSCGTLTSSGDGYICNIPAGHHGPHIAGFGNYAAYVWDEPECNSFEDLEDGAYVLSTLANADELLEAWRSSFPTCLDRSDEINTPWCELESGHSGPHIHARSVEGGTLERDRIIYVWRDE